MPGAGYLISHKTTEKMEVLYHFGVASKEGSIVVTTIRIPKNYSLKYNIIKQNEIKQSDINDYNFFNKKRMRD